jgi:translation initiation factor 2 beta subunit (eIF-2beta)/eIF-5
MDGIELKVAERYITRSEVSESMKRFEEHFVRIESKIDNLFTRK